MPLGRGITEVFEAIPERIEVSGHAPTWRVTGGSFEDVVAFANEAFDHPAVIGRQDRSRWWPRVTLTVTTDPAAAADAPALATFADPDPSVEAPGGEPATPATVPAQSRRRLRRPKAARQGRQGQADPPPSPLEDIFAYQEEQRLARKGIPEQRTDRG